MKILKNGWQEVWFRFDSFVSKMFFFDPYYFTLLPFLYCPSYSKEGLRKKHVKLITVWLVSWKLFPRTVILSGDRRSKIRFAPDGQICPKEAGDAAIICCTTSGKWECVLSTSYSFKLSVCVTGGVQGRAGGRVFLFSVIHKMHSNFSSFFPSLLTSI